MKHLISFLLVLIASFPVFAEEESDKEQMIKLADEFAQCAGFKNATAKHAKKLGGGENMVETFEGGARGSRIVAMHLLSIAHSNGDKSPIEYEKYVDSIAYTIETRVGALWETPETDKEAREEIAIYGNRCGELSKFQADYLDELRKEKLLPK